MSNQLPMAINPSVNYNNNFHLINMPQLGQHPFLDVFVIEANTKTISESIAIFLGIGYDECIGYIGINNFTHCQFPRDGFKGHYMRYKGITLDQLRTLVDIAKSKGAVKFIPILSELILTQVLPLFNTQPPKHDDFKKEIDMNLITSNQPLTMSSLEIAEMCEKRHDHVMRDIKDMLEQLDISSPQFWGEYKASNGKTNPCFNLDKEMSLTLVAGYNVKIRHKIIQRWQELENQVAAPALPSNYKEALLALVQKVDETERLTAENEHLNKTKMQISSKREATALGKLARANDKIKQLTAMANVKDMSETIQSKAVKFATILAIQSRVDNLKANGLKLANFCRRQGLEIKSVDDVRFGRVNSYPAEAWREVYNININSILGV